jgi:glycogen(starch) synthase
LKILVVSQTYLPNVGGLEMIMSGLVRSFAELGHEVQVITATAAAEKGAGKVTVHRQPGLSEQYRLYRSADIVLEANIGLKTAILGLWFRKKWWVVHHIHYQHGKGPLPYLKNFLTFFSNNIAVSSFIRKMLWGRSHVIENFYDDEFRDLGLERTNDLVFVGRLVSDKGAVLLLEALKILRHEGLEPRCIIAGEGPELEKLRKFSAVNSLSAQVSFPGVVKGNDLVTLLNSTRIQVVPSTWDEPFGIVVLEGMACGCDVIAADAGGLPEAVGKAGWLFRRGDCVSLAGHIRSRLNAVDKIPNDYVAKHLEQHRRMTVARAYIKVFSQ